LGRCYEAAKRAIHANRSTYAAGKDQVAGQSCYGIKVCSGRVGV